MDDTSKFFIGDTVVMDNHIGFFVRRVGDVRVSLLITNSRTLDSHKGGMLTFYNKIIPCRAVLTEKVIDFDI